MSFADTAWFALDVQPPPLCPAPLESDEAPDHPQKQHYTDEFWKESRT